MTERTLPVRENAKLKGMNYKWAKLETSLFTNLAFVSQICMQCRETKEPFAKRTNALPFIRSGTFLRDISRLLIQSGRGSGLVRSLQIVISRCTSSGLGSCCFAMATER